ncbi:MAG: VWA domain-containing protein [Burkholderiaceae bacterium]|nr:VWA domain-containing protein [Burkholderiaceae bacterium]
MRGIGSRTLLALALQLAALLALSLSLLGASWLDVRSKPRVLVVVDRSQSVPRAAGDKAIAEVMQAAKAAGGQDVQLIEFAGRPAARAAKASEPAADLDPSVSNIEAALEAALTAHAKTPFASAVVISDGLETVGDTARALRAVREARLPVQWIPVGREPPQTRIAEVLVPDHARLSQRVQITVRLAGRLESTARVKATVRTAGGDTQTSSAPSSGAGLATIEFDARSIGAMLVDVALEDPVSGRVLDAMPDAAVIDVAPRAAILYAQGATGALARSLAEGGWSLDVVPAARLDAHADGLDRYQSVVLEDVAVSDAGPRFWSALVDAVNHRGLGLMVLGGERSYARGGYRESTLESVLPVSSEPAALDQPAAIVFAVDKSGSMGQGSGGVDRFALAQRAVIETARGLTARDSLGLVVFDVVPRVLIPLGPSSVGSLALERDWQVRPNGGTKLAPALEAAIGELERADASRRMLIVVTDGFVEGASLEQLRARLDRSRIEMIALAVGPDADVSALERLAGVEAGLVLRVNEAAELPVVMRAGLERRRARVERGTIAVEQRQALPFLPGTWKDWPAVTAHAVTRPRPDAVVAVQSQRGEPLISFRRSGLGRVVAVTSGLGPWTPQWLSWREWPQLAGGLATWISGTPQGGALGLSVSDLPGGLQVEADVPGAAGPPDGDALSITVDTPAAQGRLLDTDLVGPGRLRAVLPDAGAGLYTFVVSTPLGTQRQLHLRRHRGENESWGVNPALDAWTTAGLVSAWTPASLARHRGVDEEPTPVDRTLIGLALVLFLSGVLVDRTRLTVAGVREILGRLRTRIWRSSP